MAERSTGYQLGRALEYRVRDKLTADGYFCIRAAASKGLVDIIAIKRGQVLFVQCKRSGSLPPGEWNELYEAALHVGAIPVMASRRLPSGIALWRLDGRKDGTRRRQPMKPFVIDEIAQKADL